MAFADAKKYAGLLNTNPYTEFLNQGGAYPQLGTAAPNVYEQDLYRLLGGASTPTNDNGATTLSDLIAGRIPLGRGPSGRSDTPTPQYNLFDALARGLITDPELKGAAQNLLYNQLQTDEPYGVVGTIGEALPFAIAAGAIGGGAIGAAGSGAPAAGAAAEAAAAPTAGALTPAAAGGLSGTSLGALGTASSTAGLGAAIPATGGATAASTAPAAASGALGLKDILAGGAALASAGGSIYSGIQQDKALGTQADLAKQQAAIAQSLFDQSQGLRGLSYGQLQDYLATGAIPQALGGYDPNLYGLDTFLQTGQLPKAVDLAPTTAYSRDVLEQQFGRARENLIGQAGAQGGHLGAALGDLEAQRALGVTGLYSQEAQQRNALAQQLYGVGLDVSREKATQDQALRKALFSSALGIGQGDAGTALQGLAGASGSFGQVAAGRLGQSNQLQDAFGTFLGYAYGIPQAKAKADQSTASLNQSLAALLARPAA